MVNKKLDFDTVFDFLSKMGFSPERETSRSNYIADGRFAAFKDPAPILNETPKLIRIRSIYFVSGNHPITVEVTGSSVN